MTKRPIKITVRLSQTEAVRFDALASECGSKKEPLIRNLIMGVEIKPRPTEEQLRLALPTRLKAFPPHRWRNCSGCAARRFRL